MDFRYIDLLEGIKFSEDETPTSEIQLFKIGEWKTHPSGKFKITEDMLKEFVKNFDGGLRDVVVDYQHGSLETDPDKAKAAGWVKKLVNKGKDGLWARVEWTKKAAGMIKEKEYRYISPEFSTDYANKETKKKQGPTLLAAAITNRPYMEGMAPVALSDRAMAEESLDEKREKIATAYRKQFISPYRYSFPERESHWVSKVYETYIIVRRGDKLFKFPYTVKGDEVKFGNPVEVELEKNYKEKGKTTAENPADMPAHIKSTEGGSEMKIEEVREALQLDENTSEQDVLAEIKKLKEAITLKEGAEDTVKLVEFQRIDKELAVTKKLAEATEKRADKLELELLEKERDGKIEKAIAAGKIVPANKELFESYYMKDPEEATKLIDALPVVLEFNEKGSAQDQTTGTAGEQLSVKCAEKRVADPKLTYSEALLAVQRENPDLAKECAKEAGL